MKSATFFSYSFGCRVNEAEKEEIDRQMVKSGFQFDANRPEIYIINTCSITQKAEREVRQFIYQVKKRLPETKIVITGCAATYWLKNKLYPDLVSDLLIDNVNKEFLVKLISHKFPHRSGEADGLGTVQNQIVLNKFIGSGRIMVKIQDGCQRFCSYCVVPYLRGTPKSLKKDYLVNKINQLTKTNRINEVILTAINTEAYGIDTNESLTDLLKKIIDKTHIPRISLGSIHPWSINDDFFKFYKEYLPKKRLVDFFHIPLQSGSNKMLNLMKRGYAREEMLQKLKKIKSLNEHALIATDVIVGYFEETDSDFQDTYDFLKESPIVKFHVFRYSKRDNTAGFYMAKQLKEPSPKKKSHRAKELINLGKRKYEEFLQKNVGRASTVLFLNRKFENYQEALLDNQLPIYIKITGNIHSTGLCKAKILEYEKGKLFGKIV